MTLTSGITVKAKDSQGSIVHVELLHRADEFSNLWWVKYVDEGRPEVTLYEEDDLLQWNAIPEPCVCGSWTAGQSNKHSFYCKAIN